MILQLKNVSKYYSNGHNANKGLDDISITFQTGEFVAITGESGSGKTTLLNVASTLMDIDQGDFLIDGKDTYEWNQEKKIDFRRRNVGFVFQEYNVIVSLSALDNILLALYNIGYTKKEAKEKAYQALEKVGLKGYEKKKVALMSGGEKQRVVLARALASDCPFFAIDEPTGNLDSKTGRDIIKLISEFSKDRLILYVTHDFDSVKDIVTRHITLKDGKVEKDETLKKLNENNFENKEEKKPLGLIHNAFKVLFSSPSRFLLMIISLILFSLASVGIGLNANTLLLSWSSNNFDKQNYFTNDVDSNSLVYLTKDKGAYNLNEENYVVDKGNITSNVQLGIPLNFATYSPEESNISYGPVKENISTFSLTTHLDTNDVLSGSLTDEDGFYVVYSSKENLSSNLKKKIKEFYNTYINQTNLLTYYFLNDESKDTYGMSLESENYINSLPLKGVFLYESDSSSYGISAIVPSNNNTYKKILKTYFEALLVYNNTEKGRVYKEDGIIEKDNGSYSLISSLKNNSNDSELLSINLNGNKVNIKNTTYYYDGDSSHIPFMSIPTYYQDKIDNMSITLLNKEIPLKTFIDRLTQNNSILQKPIFKDTLEGSYTDTLNKPTGENSYKIFNDYFSQDGAISFFDNSFSTFKEFILISNYLNETVYRVFSNDSTSIQKLENDLRKEGYSATILSKEMTSTMNKILGALVFIVVLGIIVAYLIIYFIFYAVTSLILKNITRRFNNDNYVLFTLGYSTKSLFGTKFIFLVVPIILTYLVTATVILIVLTVFEQFIVLPYLYIYFLILIVNVLLGLLFAIRWQKRERILK